MNHYRQKKGKFDPKWEGPYVVEQVYDGGAYQLIDQASHHGLSLLSESLHVKFLSFHCVAPPG